VLADRRGIPLVYGVLKPGSMLIGTPLAEKRRPRQLDCRKDRIEQARKPNHGGASGIGELLRSQNR